MVLTALATLLFALPANAAAAPLDVKAFSVTSNNTQAGANANLTMSMTYCTRTNGTDPDPAAWKYCTSPEASTLLNRVSIAMPPGLIANPSAAAKCPRATFQAMQTPSCPSGSKIGEMAVSATIGTDNPLMNVTGDVYNLEPVGSEVGRLGFYMDLDTGQNNNFMPTKSETSVVLTSDQRMATKMSENLPTDLKNASGGAMGWFLKVHRLSFTLWGTVNGKPFIQNPTSCATGAVRLESTGSDGVTVGKDSTYTPTGCSSLAFAPSINVAAGSAGQTARGSAPPVAIGVDVPSDQSAIDSSSIRLPDTIRPSVMALNSHACSPDLAAAGACPPNSRIGSISTTTPLSTSPLSGPLYLVKESGQLKMGLLAKLSGPANVDLRGSATFDGNSSVATFSNLPDVPTNDFTLSLYGGADGVFTALTDLCGTTPVASATLVGKNGKVSNRAIPINIEGCGAPAVSIQTGNVDVNSNIAPVIVKCLPQGRSCKGSLAVEGLAKAKAKGKKRAKKSKVTAMGNGSFTIQAGSKATVGVRLSSAAKKALKKKPSLKVTVKAKLDSGGGSTQALTLKIDPPAKKAKKKSKKKR